MKKRDIIFNTMGYSISEIEKMDIGGNNPKLDEIIKEVKKWRFIEKMEYFEDLKELCFFIKEKKKLNISSKEDKKKIVGEIMKYIKTQNVRDGEEILSAIKKEIESGGLSEVKK